MSGLLQLAGALVILSAFAAVQTGLAQPSSRITLMLNLLGSTILAVLALRGRQWGFLLLEAAWATVSAASLAAQLIARRRALGAWRRPRAGPQSDQTGAADITPFG